MPATILNKNTIDIFIDDNTFLGFGDNAGNSRGHIVHDTVDLIIDPQSDAGGSGTLKIATGGLDLNNLDITNVNEINLGNLTSTGTASFSTITDLGTVTTADIDGGTIDGTTIGSTTTAAGNFSTLGVSDNGPFSPMAAVHTVNSTDKPAAILENTAFSADLILDRSSAAPTPYELDSYSFDLNFLDSEYELTQTGGILGSLLFRGKNSAGVTINYGSVTSAITDATAGSETGDLIFSTNLDGKLYNRIYVKASGNVGVKTNTPSTDFEVNGEIKTVNLTSTGTASLGGDTLPSTTNAYKLGSTANKWSEIHATNVFSGDLHLSNEHQTPNDVDGTQGSWLIQEGKENLYLINKNTGKKYKFTVEEIE